MTIITSDSSFNLCDLYIFFLYNVQLLNSVNAEGRELRKPAGDSWLHFGSQKVLLILATALRSIH